MATKNYKGWSWARRIEDLLTEDAEGKDLPDIERKAQIQSMIDLLEEVKEQQKLTNELLKGILQ